MDAQLTRRGTIVAVVTVGTVLLSATFGTRSLNAVVVPGVVALGVALFVVHRAEPPTVSRTVPPNGPPGESHLVSLDVEDCGAGNYAIRDWVGDGLAAPEETFHVTEASETVSYEVTFERRGVHEFGPVKATVTDVLGLARRQFRIEVEEKRVLVYPRLVDPSSAVRSCLETVVDLERRPGRDEFDSLREYVRGDSLRDVHWKSSAKQPDEDLVVKEFLGRTPTDAVRIGVGATGSRDSSDAAASAAASVAITLLDEGVGVGVETPDGTVEPGVGTAKREAILGLLARFGVGSPPAADATLRITASDGEAVVHAGGRSVPFRGVDRAAGPASSNRRPSGSVAGDGTRPDSGSGGRPGSGGDGDRPGDGSRSGNGDQSGGDDRTEVVR